MAMAATKQVAAREAFLSARPCRATGAVVDRRSDGTALVTISRSAPWPWNRAGRSMPKSFELDEIGLWVWDACDGEATLLNLIEGLARHYRLGMRDAEVATTRFLEILAARRLITVETESR